MAELGEDIRYMAGFFDADGFISISRLKRDHKRGVHYRLTIGVTQKYPAILTKFKDLWGGRLFESEGVWYWRADGKRASAFLSDLLPYLHLKRSEAQLAVEFQEKLFPRAYKGSLSDEEFAFRKSCFSRMQYLKKNRS